MNIIGRGLAGLATGCYGQKNEYTTRILEMQEKPGGVFVYWKRKGYIFDCEVHKDFGTTPNTVNNQMHAQLVFFYQTPKNFSKRNRLSLDTAKYDY